MPKLQMSRAAAAVTLMVVGVLALIVAAALAYGPAAGLAVLGVAAVALALLIGWSK